MITPVSLRNSPYQRHKSEGQTPTDCSPYWSDNCQNCPIRIEHIAGGLSIHYEGINVPQ